MGALKGSPTWSYIMTIDPRISAKIRKLLALAADPSAAPQEAETAARQASKLMAAHDLSLADLTEAELRDQWDLTTTAAQGCRPGKKNPSEVPPWIGIIAWGVKTYTRTRVSGGRGIVYFKGPREDTELARWLHELLLNQAYTQSKGLPAGEANAFRNGFAAALQRRLKDLAKVRDQSDTEESNGTALVRVQDARQRAMNDAFGEEAGGRKSQARSSADGYEAGSKAHIPTGRPLSSASGLLLN